MSFDMKVEANDTTRIAIVSISNADHLPHVLAVELALCVLCRATGQKLPLVGADRELSLLRMDLVILDELGCLPFSQAGRALLFHLPLRL